MASRMERRSRSKREGLGRDGQAESLTYSGSLLRAREGRARRRGDRTHKGYWPLRGAANLHRCTDAGRHPKHCHFLPQFELIEWSTDAASLRRISNKNQRIQNWTVCLPAHQKECGSTHPETATADFLSCSLFFAWVWRAIGPCGEACDWGRFARAGGSPTASGG